VLGGDCKTPNLCPGIAVRLRHPPTSVYISRILDSQKRWRIPSGMHFGRHASHENSKRAIGKAVKTCNRASRLYVPLRVLDCLERVFERAKVAE